MKIASFNINNVNRRLPNLLGWLGEARPDVVCLQETKTADAEFPVEAIRKAGYHAVWRGEKRWNGVPSSPAGRRSKTRRELPGDPTDAQCRFLEAAINGVLIASIYARTGTRSRAPNSTTSSPGSNASLITHPRSTRPAPRSCSRATTMSCRPSRHLSDHVLGPGRPAPAGKPGGLQSLLKQGWIDAVRALYPTEPMYTFWDYMRNRWERDGGLRLDHLLISPAAAERLEAAGVDRHVRGLEGASDHAPVWLTLREAANGSRSSKRMSDKGKRPNPAPPGRGRRRSERPLLVIDGDSFAHRSYHALPKTQPERGARRT